MGPGDFDGFRRLSGVVVEQASEGQGGGGGVSVAPEWRPPPVHSGIRGGCAAGAGQRHHDGPGRMHGLSRHREGRPPLHGTDGPVGAAGLCALPDARGRGRGAAGPVSDRAGLHVRGIPAGVRRPVGGFGRGRLRDRGPQCGGTPALEPRDDRGSGAAAATGPAALRDGRRHAGGVAGVCRARNRHDGLRAPLAECAQRMPVHQRGEADHQAGAVSRRSAAAGPGVRMPDVQELLARLSSTFVRSRRDALQHPGDDPQHRALP